MKKCLFTLLLFCVVLFYSCDILRFSKFEVLSWSPGGGFHSEPENIVVSLSFSDDPNKASAERNFSLTGDGNRIRGTFNWEGKKLIFSPLTPLEKNNDYTINLSSDTFNKDGLNMDETFTVFFSTRQDNTRPVLLSFYPEINQTVFNPREEIKLEFSSPVLTRSLHDNVSFSPSMTGLWKLENNDKLAIFTPLEQWAQNTRYEIRLSSSLTDINGMNLRNDFLGVFNTFIDKEIPYLLSANRISKNGEIFILTSGINDDLEKDDRLSLIFSKPVDSQSLKTYLTIEDGPNLVMETSPGFNKEFIFTFETIPVYESRFTLRIKPGVKDNGGNSSKEEYVFRIFANGKFSKPPSLAGIRIPLAPNNETDKNLVFYAADSLFPFIAITNVNYPSGESVKTWIEFYFDTAQDAFIDLLSVMELFRTETSNNVISFSANQVIQNNFTIPQPQSGMENYHRIEIKGNLVNSTNFGVINFLFASGLRDNLGNVNEKLLKFSLIK